MNLLFLCTCFGNGGGKMFVIINEEKQADARIVQILATIKDKDRETLKSLFSQKALDEAEDFDSGVDYLFNFFQGNIDSWERDKWSSGEEIRNGKKSMMLRSWYEVNTDNNKYLFFIIDFPEDTINPSNIGLYTLRIIKVENEETEFGYWQDMEIPGIYNPKKSSMPVMSTN
jgi:hypothetical protein